MNEEPYASADREFWIVDNGSSHRGERSVKRLEGKWPNLRLIHLPAHASWLNQIEISSRKPYDGTGENCPSARCIQPSSGPPSKH